MTRVAKSKRARKWVADSPPSGSQRSGGAKQPARAQAVAPARGTASDTLRAQASQPLASTWLIAGWLAALPTALVLYAILIWLAPRLATQPDPRAVASLFLKAALPYVKPEPLEQTRYELAVVLVPIAQLVFTMVIRSWIVSARRNSSVPWLCRLGAILTQVGLVIFTVAMWVVQLRYGFQYFSPWWLATVLAAGMLAGGAAVYLLVSGVGRQRLHLVSAHLGAVVAPGLRSAAAVVGALVISIVVVLPALFT
ncbi:MAG TPA: hypothetical protein VMT29_01285, partial [Steroidobacteraceae bacterium]|nr:hypothetical protein [Steroidobacteraceae bacterium]